MRMSLTYIGCHEHGHRSLWGKSFFALEDVSAFETTSSVFLVAYLKPAADLAGMHVAN